MGMILMSIKPKYVRDIILGKKKYEYRTVKPKVDDVDKIIIYETSPTKKVTVEVQVLDILCGTREEIWNITKDYSGINKEFYDDYFKNTETCCAYKLGKVTVYKHPKKLEDFGIKYAPQSFIYLR